MIFRILLLSWLCWTTTAVVAQSSASPLEVDPRYSAERLVKEVFATDRCETIFNVRQIGSNPDGIGYFTGSEDIVGFNRGIVLSTGKVQNAVGPNKRTNTGSQLSGLTPDPDLDRVSTGAVYDRSGIEFDFVPLEPVITFRYVFASEEYCEFVGAKFNDIFGFFISGPGFAGPYADSAVNIALIPGTRQSVSINNVNYRTNNQYYLDNEFAATKQQANCGGSTETGPRFQSIEYDGQTVILTATVKVQVCETYHIRLLVADINDSNFDSAVFLEAGSFDLGASVSLESEGGQDEPIVVYEDCTPTTMRVVRGADSQIDRDQTINYRLSDNSVATDTADFTAGPGTVTIPAGQMFAEIPISALSDTLQEGEEEAWLILDVPCACYTDSVRIVVREAAPLEVGLDDTFYYCPDNGSTLSVNVAGGVPPYTYEWSFGSREAEPVVAGTLPDTISVRVADACGEVQTRRAATQGSDPPTVEFPTQDLTACWGEEQQIVADLTGVGPFRLTYQIDAGAPRTVLISNAGRGSWPVTRSGDYHIIGVSDRACSTEISERLRVDFYQPVLNTSFTDPTCAGSNDGTISATHLPTVEPYTYQLDSSAVDGLAFTGLGPGDYLLQVTDALGCVDSAFVPIRDPESIQPIDLTCDQLRRPPLSLNANGGIPPYEYSVDGSNYFGGELWNTLTPGTYYQLSIRDAAGCEILQPEFFFPKAAQRYVALPAFFPQDAGGNVNIRLNYQVPRNQIFSYRWEPAELFDCPTCPNPTLTAPYTQDIDLILQDIYGCTDSLTTYVAVDGRTPFYVPNVFSPNGDGNNDHVAIFANSGLVERVVSFRVYTRWGEVVWSDADFAPNSAQRGWDGYTGGQPANTGTYLWSAEIRLYNGQIERQAGSTLLISE
ncbi:gliding motility-associated-like protein [Lewinella aquimaris]|uniref:Gliding motility-associated-like protein n=1 Tax=Neolewinella aquimaris TaxID=1835722 RepID=A0A840ECZ9_9BACT|nr:choice-of-anchor L domain-containing protein [Neolewinella aquimaris]MBB4078826.1 gliding motility-associated-like protein [Neolewinella aquimaris]